jgi:hypothetical protein
MCPFLFQLKDSPDLFFFLVSKTWTWHTMWMWTCLWLDDWVIGYLLMVYELQMLFTIRWEDKAVIWSKPERPLKQLPQLISVYCSCRVSPDSSGSQWRLCLAAHVKFKIEKLIFMVIWVFRNISYTQKMKLRSCSFCYIMVLLYFMSSLLHLCQCLKHLLETYTGTKHTR